MSALTCPRCSVSLGARRLASARVHACERCGGVFIDEGVHGRLIRVIDAAPIAKAAGAELERTAAVDEAQPVRCPVCNATARRERVGAAIDIDKCPLGHGTWLDHGELPAVVEAARRAVLAIGAGTAVVGGAAIAASDGRLTERLEAAGDVVDVGLEGVDLAVGAVDVVDAAGSVADVAGSVAESAGGLLSALGSLLGGLDF